MCAYSLPICERKKERKKERGKRHINYIDLKKWEENCSVNILLLSFQEIAANIEREKKEKVERKKEGKTEGRNNGKKKEKWVEIKERKKERKNSK